MLFKNDGWLGRFHTCLDRGKSSPTLGDGSLTARVHSNVATTLKGVNDSRTGKGVIPQLSVPQPIILQVFLQKHLIMVLN